MHTVPQIAKRLGVSVALVYALVESGALPHYRLGKPGKRGVVRISEEQLATFLLARAKGGESPAPVSKPATRRKLVTKPNLQNLKLP